jgi:hypothetical protein
MLESTLNRVSTNYHGTEQKALFTTKHDFPKQDKSEQPLELIRKLLSTRLPTLAPDLLKGDINVQPLTQGSTNFTYLVTNSEPQGGESQLVVRVNTGNDRGGFQNQRSDPSDPSWSQYHKEAHWQGRIRTEFPELSSVIPEVKAVLYVPRDDLTDTLRDELRGKQNEVSISVQTKVSGASAHEWTSDQRQSAFQELGKVAAKINSITLADGDSGARFDLNTGTFYQELHNAATLAQVVNWRIDTARTTLDELAKDGIISAGQRHHSEELLSAYSHQDLSPTLIRGDLNEGCIMIDPMSAKISGLFDFETIRAGAGRVDELADRYTSLEKSDAQNFFKGYSSELGVSIEEFNHQLMPAIKGAALIDMLVQFHCSSQANTQDFTALQKIAAVLS